MEVWLRGSASGRASLQIWVSVATIRMKHMAEGATACFLSGISGWFSLSLNPLARGCGRIWRGEVWKYGFGGAVVAATLSGTGSASPPPDRNSWLRGLRRAFSPAFRAGSLYPLIPWRDLARRSMEAWLRGLRRAFSPAFRAGSLYPLIPWRVGAEESGAAKYGSMASAAPSWPRRSQVRGQLRHHPIATAG